LLLTTKSFYQGSLILPLVVPLIAYVILRWTEPSEDLGMFLGVLVVSLYAAGVPYIVLASPYSGGVATRPPPTFGASRSGVLSSSYPSS
jgi:hypothetical protein